MATEIEPPRSPDLTSLDYCWRDWMKSDVFCERNVDTRDESLARVLDAASHVKKHEEQLKTNNKQFLIRVAKCIEVDGGIFQLLIVNCYKSVICA